MKFVDPIKKEQLFNFFSKAWFPDGPNSPNLGLIKFVPTEAEFWDSPDWKVFQLFKMAKAVVSGEEYEESKDEHGKVSLIDINFFEVWINDCVYSALFSLY
ncbi:MAG: pyridoxamine 5'-phosphate oxidase family protein [Saprospiraceae bacterium]|nr:pyridoxamine 5'-phosphate oxidase family protein [Saprospiraceae bacterium]